MIALEYPPAAVWFIRYLSAELPKSFPNTPVLGEVGSRPPRFVQVTNSGGEEITYVTGRARLMVDSWAGSNRDAERLAARVFALGKAASGVVVQGVQCRKFEAAGFPVDSPDPDSKQHRYRQNIVLHFRALPL